MMQNGFQLHYFCFTKKLITLWGEKSTPPQDLCSDERQNNGILHLKFLQSISFFSFLLLRILSLPFMIKKLNAFFASLAFYASVKKFSFCRLSQPYFYFLRASANQASPHHHPQVRLCLHATKPTFVGYSHFQTEPVTASCRFCTAVQLLL